MKIRSSSPSTMARLRWRSLRSRRHFRNCDAGRSLGGQRHFPTIADERQRKAHPGKKSSGHKRLSSAGTGSESPVGDRLEPVLLINCSNVGVIDCRCRNTIRGSLDAGRELIKISALADAHGALMVPHGSGIYSYHFVITRHNSPFTEIIMTAAVIVGIRTANMGHARHRKEKIDRLKADIGAAAGISIVAVHEAGHAVARFWTAKIMEYDPAEAVVTIEIHHPDTAPKYLGADGNWYINAATTFGPRFSKQIEAASKDVVARYGIEGINARPEEYAADVMAAARAAGADIVGWVNAKMLQAVAGPVAEAKATGKSLDDMLSVAEFARDFADAANPGRIAGWSEEDISHGIANAVAIFEEELSAPQAWNALLALATSLPHEGTIDGRTCWTIFVRAFEKPDRA